jgi:DNA-binding NarL/FixJ family response regulator/tRNA A-37 threonylcarbamoyl transferase component Bud32
LQSDMHIPVVIVDDQTVMRIGLRIVLERIPGVRVVAEAQDGREAIDVSLKLRPAVILMDISMPNMDGIEATEIIKEHLPETRVVMFTSNDDEAAFLSALAAGADAYCLKDASQRQLESAMSAVLQGAKWLDHGLAKRVLSDSGSPAQRLKRNLITPQQMKIFEYIEHGLNLEEIAKRLGCDVTNVKMELRTAVDCLEPDSMQKSTRLMANLRPMLESNDAVKDYSMGETREKSIGDIVSEKYRIEKVLGRGGMSVVYLARHTTLGKLVAIKMMHLNMVATGSFLQRFEREARIASSLNHTHIVGVHDFGEDENGQPYLIMDYVNGETMEALIEEREKLDPGFCIPIFMQICDALTTMHHKGFVHRDLKPSNVIVKAKSGGIHITLVDLGIAKSVVETNSSARLTAHGQMFGSPTYMSPEQCIGQDADFRSDLYALGCLMYDALCGRPPFDHDSTYNVMWQHVNEPPSRLPFLAENNKTPEQMQSIVFKLLHKDPEQRYQSADEVKAELNSLLQETRSAQ